MEPQHLDPDLTVPAFLRRIADRSGDHPALVFQGEPWSYRRLQDEVTRMERALLGLGVGKGTRVALIMGNRPEWVVAALASMSLGAVTITLSTYEPALKLHQQLRHADASVVILQDRLLKHTYLADLVAAVPALEGDAPVHDETLPFLREVVFLGEGKGAGHVHAWQALLDEAPELSPSYLRAVEDEVHPTDDALVIYTSGTSGPAKGVIHTHRSVTVQFNEIGREFTLTPDDVLWGTYPLFWSAGAAWLLGAALGSGATLVLQETYDAVDAVRLIEMHRVTLMHVTAPQLTQLAQALEAHPADISSLRIFPRGSTLEKYVDLPPDRPFGGASLGLTEALTLASSIPWDSPVELRLTTHGRPLPGMSLKIVDPETHEVLGPNAFGEIAIKGTRLMRGYHKVFPESYLDEAGYYLTKDGGYVDDDGYLHWTGRISEVIRTSAANVSPAEVEAALYEHPDVSVASVVGHPDPEVGEVIVAVAVAKEGTAPSEAMLRAHLKERLASYKIPVRIFIADRDEVPMTASSKPVLSAVKTMVAAKMGEPPVDALPGIAAGTV
jgi:fatty-acyl-CoA synthase